MANWWKRFFGLDDDWLDDEDTYNGKETDGLGRSLKGRFEDPGRRIEVRMVKQFPELTKPRSPIQSDRWKNEPWDEPAYVRRSRTRVEEKASATPQPAYDRHKGQKADKKDQQIERKKEPFRPSMVASPIFGYRQRPKVRPLSSEGMVRNPELDSLQRAADEERDIASPLDVAEPLFPTTVSEPVRERVTDRLMPDITSADDSTTGGSERKETVRHVVGAWKITESETNKGESNVTFRRVDSVQAAMASNNDNEINDPKEKIEILPKRADCWSEPEKTFDTEQKPSVGEVNDGEKTANEQEERTLRDGNADGRVAESGKSSSYSTIPYNVLMYGADKQALRRKPSYKSSVTADQRSYESHAALHDQGNRTVPLSLFREPPENLAPDEAWIAEKQETLKQVLKNFHVRADMVGFVQGPSVTRFEIRLHPGVKVSKVVGLTEDIKLSMAAEQIRIAPVAGKSTVGIEIPNLKRKPVFLKTLLRSKAFSESASPLTAALGMDVSGQEVITDLAKMPHGLIAGATGSGKSVCIHSLILSLIYKSDPESLRLVLIDPKVVELSVYQRLPHLAAPVINQPKEAALALRWAVDEMERRYQAFADLGVRDIKKYNQIVGPDEKWPYIVIIIDELADLMMTSPQDVEEAICRIAQKARAAGIHMILATQRPSVDVITGLIKANIPTRIAFGVSSQADSRTILDAGGAERLLGQGDMLFAENGSREIRRLQGAFVSDEEIERITEFMMSWPAPPHLFDPSELREQRQMGMEEEDELYEEAAQFVISQGQASVSSLQRHFRIGYNRAARLIDALEANAIISSANGSKPRQVLVTKEAYFTEEDETGL